MYPDVWFLLSFLCTAGWCYLGVRWFGARKNNIPLQALLFGALKLVIAFVVRFLIFYASYGMEALTHDASSARLLLYVFLYLPGLWFEWSVVGALIAGESFRLKSLLLGTNERGPRWRAGGASITFVFELQQTILWTFLLEQIGRGTNL